MAQSSVSHVESHWQLLPWFLLRQAGFPIEWLEELSAPSIHSEANRLFNAQESFMLARRAALDVLRDALRSNRGSELERPLLTAHTLIRKEKQVPANLLQEISCKKAGEDVFNAITACNSSLEYFKDVASAFAQVYSETWERGARQLLHRFHTERWLQEALLLSNESHFDRFHAWIEAFANDQLALSKDRSKIDLLSRYFQRVCAKNETTSHFGPFAVGLVASRPTQESLYFSGENALERYTFYAHWAATELARVISLHPTLYPSIRPRWNSFIFLDDDHLFKLDYNYDLSQENEVMRGLRVSFLRKLTEEETFVLRACNGQRTIQELSRWWQVTYPDRSETLLHATLASLKQAGALIVEFEIPAGSCDTLADLKALLPMQCSEARPWIEIVDAFKEELQRFAGAESLLTRRKIFTELKEQFAQLTGAAPERGLGQVTADRSILFEECQRAVADLRMGSPLAEAIKTELAPFYDLLLVVPRNRLVAEKALLNTWFVNRFGENQQVSLLAFLSAFTEDGNRLEHEYATIDANMYALSQIIDDTLMPQHLRQEHVLEIDPATIQHLVAAYHAPIPAICDADVMLLIDSPDAFQTNKYQLLVGDCHATRDLLSHATTSAFIAEKYPEFAETVMNLYQAIVEDDEIVVDPIRSHRAKTSAQVVLPCFDLEVNGRSPKTPSVVLHLNDLAVRQTPQGLRLYAPHLDKFLRLMSPAFLGARVRRNPFSISCFPRHTHGSPVRGTHLRHMPRIVMNRIILQREVWRIPCDEFKKSLWDTKQRLSEKEGITFLQAKKLQRTLKLPQHCFAMIPGEPKPIHVDFNAPLFVRQLVLLANQSSGLIEFSEMLPGPDQLWMHDSQGHYTAEFRCALFNIQNA